MTNKFIRSRLRNCAITSFKDSGKIIENNLSKKEHLTLKNLIKNRDLIIQNVDKGNTVVVLNKNDYISQIKVILSDSPKFQKLSIDQNKILHHIAYMENRIIDVLKKLKNKKVISEKKYKDLYPVGSSPGRAAVVIKFISLLRMLLHLSDLFYQLWVHLHINYLNFLYHY